MSDLSDMLRGAGRFASPDMGRMAWERGTTVEPYSERLGALGRQGTGLVNGMSGPFDRYADSYWSNDVFVRNAREHPNWLASMLIPESQKFGRPLRGIQPLPGEPY